MDIKYCHVPKWLQSPQSSIYRTFPNTKKQNLYTTWAYMTTLHYVFITLHFCNLPMKFYNHPPSHSYRLMTPVTMSPCLTSKKTQRNTILIPCFLEASMFGLLIYTVKRSKLPQPYSAFQTNNRKMNHCIFSSMLQSQSIKLYHRWEVNPRSPLRQSPGYTQRQWNVLEVNLLKCCQWLIC